MHFGFVLELSDIDLWNIDLLNTHLDLLDTDIPSKYFVCLHSVFKKSSRYVFKISSRHVLKTSSRHLQRNNFLSFKTSSIRLQDVFARRLQDVFKTSWKTKNCYAEDVLKTSSRHVLKTNKCLLGYNKGLLCLACESYYYFRLLHVHGKTTGEWHSDDIRVHTSDKWVT